MAVGRPRPDELALRRDLLDLALEHRPVARAAVRRQVDVLLRVVDEIDVVAVRGALQLVVVDVPVGRNDGPDESSVQPVDLEVRRRRRKRSEGDGRPAQAGRGQQRRIDRDAAGLVPPDRDPVRVEDRDVMRRARAERERRRGDRPVVRIAGSRHRPVGEVRREAADVIRRRPRAGVGGDRGRLVLDELHRRAATRRPVDQGRRARAGPGRDLHRTRGIAADDVVVDGRRVRGIDRRGHGDAYDQRRADRGGSGAGPSGEDGADRDDGDGEPQESHRVPIVSSHDPARQDGTVHGAARADPAGAEPCHAGTAAAARAKAARPCRRDRAARRHAGAVASLPLRRALVAASPASDGRRSSRRCSAAMWSSRR